MDIFGDMKRHELSAICTDMPDDEFEELCADVKKRGLVHPIIVFENQILDGWHRYRACLRTHSQPKFLPMPGKDPVDFVISTNIHRRNLSGAQRGIIVTLLHNWKSKGRPLKNEPAQSNAQMAKQAGVSERTIKQAKKAVQENYAQDILTGERTLYPQNTKKTRNETHARQNAKHQVTINDLREENKLLRETAEAREIELQRLADLVAGYQAESAMTETEHQNSLMGYAEQSRALENQISDLKRSLHNAEGRADYYLSILKQNGIEPQPQF